MGLDIFLNLSKKTRERKPHEKLSKYLNEIDEAEDARWLSLYKQEVKDYLKKMRAAESEWKEKHPGEPFEMSNLWMILNDFDYDMSKYLQYDFQREGIKKATSIKEIGDWAKANEKNFYKPSAAYFRKVNCIYQYFRKRLVDEQCIVTKKDIMDIMRRASKVLEARDEETSAKLLPTTGGFFFGNTGYNSWYYNDMVEILKEFGKLLNQWEEDDICYVRMSW